ncbi:MAG: hypothetical protein V4448_07915 [Pseudomonadota bacterium]
MNFFSPSCLFNGTLLQNFRAQTKYLLKILEAKNLIKHRYLILITAAESRTLGLD